MNITFDTLFPSRFNNRLPQKGFRQIAGATTPDGRDPAAFFHFNV